MHQTFPDADSTEDPLKSELFHHWNSVAERFGIEFEVKYMKGQIHHQAAFFTEARAEDTGYDLIQTESLFPISLATEGRLCNLKNLDFPDLEEDENGKLLMPWWPESVEQYTQHGGLYFIGSNTSALGISNMSTVFINDGLVVSKGLASPVESVVRGLWTVEEMTNVAKLFVGTAEDAATEADKYYGLVVDHSSRVTSLYYSSGFTDVINNADGVGELAYDDESELEAITKALENFSEMFTGPQTKIHRISDRDVYDELLQGRTCMLLGYMQIIREMENTEDYTVVPLPLLDESQSDPDSPDKGYRTCHRDCFDLWSIPTTTDNKVLSGFVLEANASGEYRKIGPFYYDQYLKDRYSNGANGRTCFDILRASVVYDLGRIGQLAGFGSKGSWGSCFTDDGFKNIFAADMKGKLETQKYNFEKMLADMKLHVDK